MVRRECGTGGRVRIRTHNVRGHADVQVHERIGMDKQKELERLRAANKRIEEEQELDEQIKKEKAKLAEKTKYGKVIKVGKALLKKLSE